VRRSRRPWVTPGCLCATTRRCASPRRAGLARTGVHLEKELLATCLGEVGFRAERIGQLGGGLAIGRVRSRTRDGRAPSAGTAMDPRRETVSALKTNPGSSVPSPVPWWSLLNRRKRAASWRTKARPDSQGPEDHRVDRSEPGRHDRRQQRPDPHADQRNGLGTTAPREVDGVTDPGQPRLDPVGVEVDAGRVPGPVVVESDRQHACCGQLLGHEPVAGLRGRELTGDRGQRTTAPAARLSSGRASTRREGDRSGPNQVGTAVMRRAGPERGRGHVDGSSP